MTTSMTKKLFHLSTLTAAVLALSFAARNAQAQRPLGVDVYAGNGSVNWNTANNNGVKFAYAKATEGNYYEDAQLGNNMANGKNAGVLMGCYHFARPDINGPGTEMNYFWNFAGSHMGSGGSTIMPMLDMETFTGHQGATSYTDWANTWSSELVTKAANVGSLKVHPICYVSACNGCEFNSNISLYSWIANYNGENLYTGNPWNICTSCEVWGSGAWDLWQVTDLGSVPGISGDVDMDTYHGTFSALQSKLVVTASP